jgi:hypothetical protein
MLLSDGVILDEGDSFTEGSDRAMERRARTRAHTTKLLGVTTARDGAIVSPASRQFPVVIELNTFRLDGDLMYPLEIADGIYRINHCAPC